MPRDPALQLQGLLAKLEGLDRPSTSDLDIPTRRSEIFQSILQLFAANLENSGSGRDGVSPLAGH
jgi:hypothetical protein